MNGERWGWVRDWAFVGASTSAVSPLVAGRLLPIELDGYAAVAALLGGASGAVVGWGLAAALDRVPDRVPDRSRVAMTAVLAPIPLGAWGGAVALGSAVLTQPLDLVPLALACGTAAALVQTLWSAPLYVWLARRGWPRSPLVIGGALVSPLSGLVGVLAGLLTMDLIRWVSGAGMLWP